MVFENLNGDYIKIEIDGGFFPYLFLFRPLSFIESSSVKPEKALFFKLFFYNIHQNNLVIFPLTFMKIASKIYFNFNQNGVDCSLSLFYACLQFELFYHYMIIFIVVILIHLFSRKNLQQMLLFSTSHSILLALHFYHYLFPYDQTIDQVIFLRHENVYLVAKDPIDVFKKQLHQHLLF